MKKNITPTKQIVASGNSEHVNIFTVIFNLLILIIILCIQNNNSWLVNSGLMNIHINRFLPLILFEYVIQYLKYILKLSKFMTYDSFLMIKFISMFCNTIMLFIIFNYKNNIAKRIEDLLHDGHKSVDDAVDALEMVDVGKDTMFQNEYILEKIC